MRVLLDTHMLLWCLQGSKKLPVQAIDIIQSAEEVYASVASLWEIAIKYSLGKLNIDIDFAELDKAIVESGYEYLPRLSKSRPFLGFRNPGFRYHNIVGSYILYLTEIKVNSCT